MMQNNLTRIVLILLLTTLLVGGAVVWRTKHSLPTSQTQNQKTLTPEEVIRGYFNALTNKDGRTALSLLSPQLQVLLDVSRIEDGAAALDGLTIKNMEIDELSDSVGQYKVIFEAHLVPGKLTSWKEGENTRYIAVRNIYGNWRISKIALVKTNIHDARDIQETMPLQISEKDNGSTNSYAKETKFTILLPQQKFPRASFEVNCDSEGVLSDAQTIESVQDPYYAIRYSTQKAGICKFQNGDFQYQLKVF